MESVQIERKRKPESQDYTTLKAGKLNWVEN
jgi:hypothetical protein